MHSSRRGALTQTYKSSVAASSSKQSPVLFASAMRPTIVCSFIVLVVVHVVGALPQPGPDAEVVKRTEAAAEGGGLDSILDLLGLLGDL